MSTGGNLQWQILEAILLLVLEMTLTAMRKDNSALMSCKLQRSRSPHNSSSAHIGLDSLSEFRMSLSTKFDSNKSCVANPFLHKPLAFLCLYARGRS